MADTTVSLDRSSIQDLVKEMVDQGAFGSGKKNDNGSGSKGSKNKSDQDKEKKNKKEQIKANIKLLNQDHEKQKQNKIALDSTKQLIKDNGGAFRKLTKAQRELVKSTGSLSLNFQAAIANAPGDALEAASDKIKGSLSKIPGASEAFDMLGKKSMVAAVGIGAAGFALGAFAGYVMKTLDTYSQLADSGVQLGGGLAGVAMSASSLNMSLDEFSGLASTYARTFNKYGKSFTDIVGKSATQMQSFGLTTSQTAEYVGEYLDNQRKMGVFASISNNKSQQSMIALASQADELSMAFGTSKEEIQKGLAEAFDDPMITSAMRSLPEEARLSFQKSMQYFQAASPQLAKSISEMVGSEIPQLTGAYQTAMTAGVPGVANAMKEYAEQIKAGVDEDQARSSLLKKMSNADTQRLRVLASAGDASAQSMLAQVEAAKQAVEAESKMTAQQLIDHRRNRAAQARMQDFMKGLGLLGDKVMSGILSAFGGPDGVEGALATLGDMATKLGEGLGWLVKKVAGVAEFFADPDTSNFSKILSVAFIGLIPKLAGFVVKGLGSMLTSLFTGGAVFTVAKAALKRIPIVGLVFGGLFSAWDEIMAGGDLGSVIAALFDGMVEGFLWPFTAAIDWLFGTDITGFIDQINIFGGIADWLGGIGTRLGGAIFDMVQGVINIFTDPLGWIADKAKGLWELIKEYHPAVLIGGLFKNLYDKFAGMTDFLPSADELISTAKGAIAGVLPDWAQGWFGGGDDAKPVNSEQAERTKLTQEATRFQSPANPNDYSSNQTNSANQSDSASKVINNDKSIFERQVAAQEEANYLAKVSQDIQRNLLEEAKKTRKGISGISLSGDI